jgi:hypothetical protein
MGQISIYTLPTLRRQILFSCIKASDINALSSVQFSPFTHAFYLQSSSELAQVTFSPQNSLLYSMSITYDKLQRRTIQRAHVDKSNLTRSPERNVSLGPDVLLEYEQQQQQQQTNQLYRRSNPCVECSRTPTKLSDHADESTITSVSDKHSETPSKSSISSSPQKHFEVEQLFACFSCSIYRQCLSRTMHNNASSTVTMNRHRQVK